MCNWETVSSAACMVFCSIEELAVLLHLQRCLQVPSATWDLLFCSDLPRGMAGASPAVCLGKPWAGICGQAGWQQPSPQGMSSPLGVPKWIGNGLCIVLWYRGHLLASTGPYLTDCWRNECVTLGNVLEGTKTRRYADPPHTS